MVLLFHWVEKQKRKIADLQTATVLTKIQICLIPQPMMTAAM